MIVEDLSTLRPGQEVRVTYRGVVQDDSFCKPDEIAVQGIEPEGARSYHYHKRDLVTVELVEPDYEHMGAYRDAGGGIWMFDRYYRGVSGGAAWFSPGSVEAYDFDTPARPLVKLVPEAPDASQLG